MGADLGDIGAAPMQGVDYRAEGDCSSLTLQSEATVLELQ
jgi:hypothetical protein